MKKKIMKPGTVCVALAAGAAMAAPPQLKKAAKAKFDVVSTRLPFLMLGPMMGLLKSKTEVICGAGSSKQIPEILKKAKISKAMIVTGPTVGRIIVPAIAEKLTATGIPYVIYDQVEENPSVDTVEAIRKRYIAEQCDGFLAVGGGSPIDAAKGAGARIVRPNKPIQKMAGAMKIMKAIPPLVAVPTTAGTGSEVTMGAVISDHAAHHKYAILDPSVDPVYAVLDPALTVSMPPFVTATTGIDALTHAVESYVTWTWNTNETNRLAEEAIVDIFAFLETAYQDGNNLAAREKMLYASYKAGLAMSSGLGYVHALAHAIGGLYNTAHGLANAVILPIVLEDYGDAVYPQLAHLAHITGIRTDGTEAEKAKAFIAAVRGLNQRLGLPTGFDFIKEEDFDQIITWALEEENGNYPVPVLWDRTHCRHVLNRIVLET